MDSDAERIEQDADAPAPSILDWSPERWSWIALLALLAVGVFVRVRGLSAYWFSPDDLLHLEIASEESLGAVWEQAKEQMHPPLVFYILHGLLGITVDPTFWRFASIVVGIALIVGMYALGRVALGAAGAVAMAAVATFGFGELVLSQIIRPYCALALLIGLALIAWLRWLRPTSEGGGQRRDLVLYAVTATLAAFLHYSAILALAAIGVVWFVHSAVRRAPRRAWLEMFAAHVPALALFGFFYWIHIRERAGLYSAIKTTYVGPFWIDSMEKFGSLTIGLFGFLTHDAVAGGAVAVSCVGLVALWWMRRRLIAGVIVAVFAWAVLLNLLDKYPFGPQRHSFYLMPFVALTLAGAVQGAAECVWRAASAHWRARLPAASVILLGVGSLGIATQYSSTDYLRRSPLSGSYAPIEFPVLRAGFDELKGFLAETAKPNDLLICSRQASHYLRFESSYRPGSAMSHGPELLEIRALERRWWCARQLLSFGTPQDLVTALRAVRPKVDPQAVRWVWFVDVGWARGLERLGSSRSPLRMLCVAAFSEPGGGSALAFPSDRIAILVKAVREAEAQSADQAK